ncbi:MAG: 2'-5' RNA ligase family protein [Halodesulfurarchaeum sp.]
MYSLNVSLPAAVRERAFDLRPALTDFDRVRESRTQTLVLKRLPATDRREFLRTEHRARNALAGAPVVCARISGIGFFSDPPTGTGPVVYLSVDSHGIHDLHQRLVEEFGAVEPLEGDDYVPHVTLARGGNLRDAERITSRSIDPIHFSVEELAFYDVTDREHIGTISLRSEE